jgi:hypothetical protein
LYSPKLKRGFIERKGAGSFCDLIGPNMPGIPLFPVISPIKGRVDVVRHVLAGEVE